MGDDMSAVLGAGGPSDGLIKRIADVPMIDGRPAIRLGVVIREQHTLRLTYADGDGGVIEHTRALFEDDQEPGLWHAGELID